MPTCTRALCRRPTSTCLQKPVETLPPQTITFQKSSEKPHLAKDETNDCHGSAQKSSQHQEFEAVDDALVVQTTGSRHARQAGSLGTDVAEHLPDHVAEEQKVDARRDTSQNDESQLTLAVKENSNVVN
jgi:hypothetical protein